MIFFSNRYMKAAMNYSKAISHKKAVYIELIPYFFVFVFSLAEAIEENAGANFTIFLIAFPHI